MNVTVIRPPMSLAYCYKISHLCDNLRPEGGFKGSVWVIKAHEWKEPGCEKPHRRILPRT